VARVQGIQGAPSIFAYQPLTGLHIERGREEGGGVRGVGGGEYKKDSNSALYSMGQYFIQQIRFFPLSISGRLHCFDGKGHDSMAYSYQYLEKCLGKKFGMCPKTLHTKM
jgi:hypothetical protein